MPARPEKVNAAHYLVRMHCTELSFEASGSKSATLTARAIMCHLVSSIITPSNRSRLAPQHTAHSRALNRAEQTGRSAACAWQTLSPSWRTRARARRRTGCHGLCKPLMQTNHAPTVKCGFKLFCFGLLAPLKTPTVKPRDVLNSLGWIRACRTKAAGTKTHLESRCCANLIYNV